MKTQNDLDKQRQAGSGSRPAPWPRQVRKRLLHLTARLCAWGVCLLARSLPLSAVHWLGDFLGDVCFFVLRLRRGIIARNLRNAFGELPRVQFNAYGRGGTRTVLRYVVEFFKLPTIRREQIEDLVRIEGLEHLLQARALGRGVIWLSAHTGNPELQAARLQQLGLPVHFLVRYHDDPGTASLINRVRQAAGLSIIGREDARAMLRCLQQGDILMILPDQNVAVGGVVVDFFGVPATAAPGAAKLALRTGAAVVPGYAWRRPDHRIVLEFHQPLSLPALADREEGAAASTQIITRSIEQFIREHPEQWMWIHDRWKGARTRSASLPGREGNPTCLSEVRP